MKKIGENTIAHNIIEIKFNPHSQELQLKSLHLKIIKILINIKISHINKIQIIIIYFAFLFGFSSSSFSSFSKLHLLLSQKNISLLFSLISLI